MYGLDYHSVSNLEGLTTGLETFYDESEQPKLLEVFTPKLLNDEVLMNYFEFLKS